jgi:hypothetical protein
VSGFSDPLALLVVYLTPIMAPTPVVSRVPGERPVEFLQLRRVGGVALPPVRETVRIDAFAWAESEARAHLIGSYARDAIWALSGKLMGGLAVYQVGEFMGPTMGDDPETGLPRLWITYELVVRADAAIHQAP